MASAEEFSCVFCKERFVNKEDLQIHFRKHGDPKFNQSLKNKTRFQHEIDTSTENVDDKVEMIGCDVCTERFPTISKAITHKHKVHPDHDAKYFCPWCGKLFTMKHLYNRHLETTHQDMANNNEDKFHCDCCNVDFCIPSAMLHHNKFYHRQDTELPSIGISKKQKLFNQELLQIYYCPFCGEEYYNKVNLHKHMTDEHNDENQSPEEILRCSLCDAVFYHLDAYELHLTFHSFDDMYSEESEKIKIHEITEFSLESVPPLMESVENCVGESMVIKNLLADDNLNNEYIFGKIKKKHKKHKKAKKSAITLDEFLNMNKDVFGEGLDFQGIEEVPTRAVTKQLKIKKQNVNKSASTNLEKLKKQGIIVKVKQTQNPLFSEDQKSDHKFVAKPTKLVNNLLDVKPGTQKKSNVLTTSNEVLSKLLNQSNNQIKIVKKPIQSNLEQLRSLSPEKIEVTCDILNNMEFSSDGETEKERKTEKESDDLNPLTKSTSVNKEIINSLQNAEHENESQESQENSETSENAGETQKFTMDNDENNKYDSDNITETSNALEQENRNKSSIDALKNIGQHITIKSLCQSPNKLLNYVQTSESCKGDEKISQASVSPSEGIHENNSVNIIQYKNDSKKDSIKMLKNLGQFITVKPINQSIETSNDTEKIVEPKKTIKENLLGYLSEEGSQEPINNSQMKSEDINQLETRSLELWKNLNKKNITIKSMPQSLQPCKKSIDYFSDTKPDESDEDTDFDTNESHKTQTKVLVKNSNLQTKLCDQNSTKKNIYPLKSLGPEISIKPPNHSPTLINKSLSETQSHSKQISNEKESNILNNSQNVTTKPLIGMRNVNKKSDTSYSQSIDTNKSNIFQKYTRKEEQSEVEIFNIDDSDSDEIPTLESCKSQIKYKPNVSYSDKIQKKNYGMNSLNTLKNISKNIVIKSTNQQNIHTNKIIEREPLGLPKNTYETDSDNSDVPNNYESLKYNENKRMRSNVPLNALKNLGKHITIKTQKSSNNLNFKGHSADETNNEQLNYDTDSNSHDRKIAEINECNDSDDETLLKQDNIIKEPIVQSPSDSDDDTHHNYNEEIDEQLSDFESQIKVNKVKKHQQKTSQNSSGLERLGKNIAKETNIDKKIITKDESKSDSKKQKPVLTLPHNICKELSITPFRQNMSQEDSDAIPKATKNNNTSRTVNRSMSQLSKNQNNVSMNAMNTTTNKEVTVKTIQTETVIQEITTTVTKTIRTVNQTVQQVGNTSEASTSMKSLKLKQDMPSNKQVKNYQGMKIKHSSPNVNQVRSPVASTCRPVVNTSVKPSNQMVSVRPGINPRPMNTKTAMKITPSASQQTSVKGQQPMVGKPLKISPNVLNSPIKRPAQREGNGPFSCFKKPKESLIPISDVPTLSGEEDSTVHCASASYETKSNYTSTVSKTIKGNSMVMTQTKKINCSSQQQLTKLNNISGLKIMKASQKQVTQSEEKSEVSASKRTTLEAIEKLQKQGLLVKKPRVDVDYSDNNNSDNDIEPHIEENDE